MLKKNISVFLMLTITFINVYSQDITKIDINNLSKKELKDIEVQKKVCSIADSLVMNLKEKEAVLYYNKILPFISDKALRTQTLASRNVCYYYLSEYDKIFDNIYETIDYYRSVNDSSNLANAYSLAGLVYERIGLHDSAFIYFYKAMPIVEASGNLYDLSDLYHNIVSIYRTSKNYKKALYFSLKSSEITFQLRDSAYFGSIQSNIGSNYYLLGNYDSALYYYKKAIYYHNLTNNFRDIASAYDGLGKTYQKLGKLEESEKYFRKAYNFNISKAYKRGAAINLQSLSSLFRDKKQYDSAILYVKKAIVLNQELKNNSNLKDNLKTISTYYYEIKNFKNAYSYYVRYSNLNDSISTTELNNKIAELNTKYEVEKKDKEIAQQKLEIETNKVQIKQNKANQNILIIIIVSVVLITSYFIFHRRKLQKAKLLQVKQENEINLQNTKLKVQQSERKRLATILHDNIAHLLTMAQNQISNLIIKDKYSNETETLKNVEDTLKLTHKMAKIASYELEFSLVLESNLVDQLSKYINRIQHSNSPKINFEYSNKEQFDNLPDNIKTNIYSVFQEMLGNALKYSNAQNITISLVSGEGKTTLQVVDDGIGFNYEEVRHGQGFPNMKERAEKLNGKFSFESEEGFGTKLRFTV